MREKKFRAWDGEKFWEDFWLNNDASDGLDLYNDRGEAAPEPYQKQFVLQQFTGLKDASGREIYEGDIIDQHEFNSETGDSGQYSVIRDFLRDTLKLKQRMPYWKKTLVIGNIYENQGLLKD